MKLFISVAFIFFSQMVAFSQEMLGIVSSNYSGIYGISINPAGMVGSKLYMDYNLLSFQSSFVNNYMYLERDDFLDYLFHKTEPLYYTSENEERNFAIYRDGDNYYGYFNQKVLGPAAMIVDGKHAYGITTSFRTNFSYHHLPEEIGKFLYEAIDYDPQHGINYNHTEKIQVGTMAWFELGLSYAYNFKRHKWESWSLGITIKPLLGSMATYTNVDNLNYIVHNDDSATVYNTDLDYAYSIPVNYNTNSFPENPLIRGFGFGFDLGFTYAKTTRGHSLKYYNRLCEQKFDAYNYRIGISLIDIGYIRFRINSEQVSLNETSTEWYKPYDTLPDNSVNDISNKIEYYFYDNTTGIEVKNSFTMNPPAAISLQYDYAFNRFVFMNGTLIWGFNLGKSFIKRPSVLAITPRFETARFEFSLPVSIVEWNFVVPRIGFAIRYGNLFLGLDKINTLIGWGNFDGFDFYGGLRLNLSNNLRLNFIKGLCGNRKLRKIEMFDYRNF